jgi:glycosyltransferase involved in cell wall biosynthesis
MFEKGHQKQKLWVITELYYPEETSTGYYLTKIAEGLADDFDVSVICGQPNYSAKGTKAPKEEVHKNVKILRAFGTTFDKNVILFRLVNMFSLSFSTFLKALFHFKKSDKVLVVTTPPSLPFITAFAALLKGANYVLLIHDNYPEILIAANKLKAGSIFVTFLNICNRWLYKYAAKIIVVGRDMQELVGKKTFGLDIPIEIIQNWAELEQVEPLPKAENPLLGELKWKDKIVFLYAGNMGYPNDLESLIECADKLKDDDRFGFIFLGAGVKRKWLEKEVEKRELKNVKILAPRPRSEQNIFLNACDVGVVSLVTKMCGVSMPSRTYNILAAGKPILGIAETNSEIAKVIEDGNVGWLVKPNDIEGLVKLIYSIYEHRQDLQGIGERSRNEALQRYSLAVALEKYQSALKHGVADNEEKCEI